ncbi:MlaD family protein [Nocardia otitidiscaviarum]|uniref:MlaD family protein n=1 Tax=Nocardia otitidiscaviarum TaxID=1823 RepID=UPI0018936BCC|nr:MlaD family protein [Nocardia otitidiscaviarum]MBF6180083.1 mammalian cell entry protein [Nocardia otitidiscaviarum]
MPRYGMPGAATDQRTARRRGAAAVFTTAVVFAGALGYQHTRVDDRVRIQVLTARIGSGVGDGTAVVLAGVPVGRVERVDSTAPGRQRLTLVLESRAATELTEALTLDYAPSNLFGISEITLHPGTGPTPVRAGAVIDLTGPDAVVDATMGRLLEQLATTAGQVLSPELTAALTRVSTDLDALAPLLSAVVATTRTVTDTQRYAPSFLIAEYASALRGFAALIDGSVTLLDDLARIPVLRADSRADFDNAVDIITGEILPAVSAASRAAQHGLGPLTDLLPPVLQALAATVPTPRLSAEQLRVLIERIDNSFTDTPDGPVLHIEVLLHKVPAVAVPLLGGLPIQGGGR